MRADDINHLREIVLKLNSMSLRYTGESDLVASANIVLA